MVAPWVVDNSQYAGNNLPRGEVLQSRHGLNCILPDNVQGCVLQNEVTYSVSELSEILNNSAHAPADKVRL